MLAALAALRREIEERAQIDVPLYERGGSVAPWRAAQPRGDGDEETTATLMVVFDFAKRGDAGEAALVERVLARNGVDTVHETHFTYLFKALPPPTAATARPQRITCTDVEKAARMLAKEFGVLRPRVVLCVGRYSATVVTGVHFDVVRIRGGAAAWHALKKAPRPVEPATPGSNNEDYETSMQRRRIDKRIRAHRDQLTHGRVVHPPGQCGAVRGASYGSGGVALVPLQRIEGVAQRVYAHSHVCWAIATTRPEFVFGAKRGGGGAARPRVFDEADKSERVARWVANFESVKAYVLRGPPIVAAQIDDKVRDEFERAGATPDTYESVTQRFAGTNYTKLRRRLACKLLRGGAERVEFQVINIDYFGELNEFALYGKLEGGESVYCTVPHARNERIFHFYINYPRCWRSLPPPVRPGADPRLVDGDHPQFAHEKNYEWQTRDHEAVLAAKSAELRRRLRAKLTATRCSAYTEALVHGSTARSTRRLCELDAMAAAGDGDGGATVPTDALTEACDVVLRRSFKYEFRSYDTQAKPRVRVDVRYHPVLAWIVECLCDMVRDDMAKAVEATATVRRPFELKFYELDMTPVQRLTLHSNIYVGGWVCIDAHRYEIVSGVASIDRRVGTVPLGAAASTASPLGAKKSTCDLEIAAFRAHITGHNPNEHVELQLRRDELAEQRAAVGAEVARREAEAAAAPAATVSDKYEQWLRIQRRRLRSIDTEAARVDLRMRGGDAAAEPVALRRWSRNAPTRMLCMDIECMTNGRSFPDAEHCPVISIVAYVQTLDADTAVDRRSGIASPWHEVAWFCLGPVDKAEARAVRCDDDAAAVATNGGAVRTFNVYCFASERELLRAYLMFRCDRDPDIVVGHNSERFDWPYLSRRCELSGAYDAPLFECMYGTRRLFERMSVRTMRTFSKAFGAKEQRMVRMPGCSCLDTFTVFQREEKLSSYSLNALATLKFGSRKVDLPYVAIPGAFWRARLRILVYNDMDTNLTLRLLLNKNTVMSSAEFTKLAGVFSQQDSYARGQQFKVINCIYRSIENDGAHYVIRTNAEGVARLLQRVERARERCRRDNARNAADASSDESAGDIEQCDPDYSEDSGDDNDGGDDSDGCGGARKDRKASSGRWRHRQRRRRRNHGHLEISYEADDDAAAAAAQDEAEIEGMSTPDTSDGERAEWERAEQERSARAKTDAVVDARSFAGYIDANVRDATAVANRPFVFKTKAQRRDEAERRAAGFAGKPKKVSAKERRAREAAAANTADIGTLFAPATAGAGERRQRSAARSREKKLRALRKRRAAAAAAAAASDQGDGEVQYKGATCIEPRRGFHIVRDATAPNGWRAVFVLCADFSSLYPTVDIANNFCHDKKMTRRKLNKLRVPLELCRASTEAWPDERGEHSYAYFVQSDCQAALLGRCRRRTDAASLLRLFELTWPNARWRHLTTAYWRALAHWGVDVAHVVGAEAAAAGPPPFEPICADYVPPIALTEEYVPDAIVAARKHQDVPGGGDGIGGEASATMPYGADDAELDEVLLRYWEDDGDGNGDDGAAAVVRRDTVPHPSRGILPKCLRLCLTARKLVKRAMKSAVPGSAEHKSMDGAQLALKVTANSGYGVTGLDSRTAKLGDYSISASITGYGRRYLEFVKNFFVRGTGTTFTFKYMEQVANDDGTAREVERSEPFAFRGGENYGGDTDSFFNSIEGVDYAMVERMGERAFMANMQQLCDAANAQLPPPVCLLFEKIMVPFMSVNKKRYVYVDFKRTQICFKGLELARRDNCAFLRDMQAEVFRRLLLQLDIDGAVAHVREQCTLLLEGRVDLMRLVVTKQYYRATYKNDTLPHLVVIKKRAHRGEPPVEIGERVPYVIVKGTSDVRNSSLNAEDPTYVLEHDLVVDYEYYLDKQVRKPMARVFSRVPGIDSEQRAERLLFANLTRRKFAATLQPAHALHRHVRRVNECVVCAAATYQLCCERCFDERRVDVERVLRERAADAEREWRTRIDTCKRCLHQRAGDYAEAVACENTACAEYAPRKRAVAGRTKATAAARAFAAMCTAEPGSLDW